MATHDYVLANASGAAFRTDLNNALAAIVSNNSNSSSPATTYAYQWWADTSAGILKLRNSSNNAWIDMLNLDGTFVFDLEDGTASAPSLRFADDTNTGVFSSGADTFNISTGGTERLQLTNTEACFNDGGADVDFRVEGDTKTHLLFCEGETDRVGIGTDDPSTLLHVDTGTTTAVALQLSNDDNTAYSSAAEGHINTVLSLQSTTTVGQNDQSVGIQFSLGLSGQTGSIQEIAAVRTGNGAGALIFRTRNASVGRIERFRIHSDGDCEIKDGDLVIGTAGHGISFINAADTASGETVSSSVLDDYEEGTWTPEIYYQNSGDQGDATNLAQYGWYTKIGNLVTVSLFLRWTLTGSAANDNNGIKNFPFVNSSITSTYGNAGAVATVSHSGTSLASSASIVFKFQSNNSSTGIFELPDATSNLGNEMGANTGMRVWTSFSYRTT